MRLFIGQIFNIHSPTIHREFSSVDRLQFLEWDIEPIIVVSCFGIHNQAGKLNIFFNLLNYQIMKIFQLVLFIITFLHISLNAQNYGCDVIEDPDAILTKGENTPDVLLVGTFHFSYPGLDSHVTKEEEQVNVLSPKRQKEMKALVNYIAEFKPTKIMVETGANTGYLMRQFEDYLKDKKTAKAREVHQIAFPLMKQFKLDTLYGVDAPSLVRELMMSKDSTLLEPIIDAIYTEDKTNIDPYDDKYWEWYDRDDELTLQNELLPYFKHMNSDKVLNRGWGHYLLGGFKNNGYKGSDALILNWYSRNLRIFRNIQDLSEPGDRIMVLFGAGHMTILKNLFESSPEYNLVKFGTLKDKKCKTVTVN